MNIHRIVRLYNQIRRFSLINDIKKRMMIMNKFYLLSYLLNNRSIKKKHEAHQYFRRHLTHTLHQLTLGVKTAIISGHELTFQNIESCLQTVLQIEDLKLKGYAYDFHSFVKCILENSSSKLKTLDLGKIQMR